MGADSLMEYLFSLVEDPAKAEAFAADPETALRHAGFEDVGYADIKAVIPMVADYAPAGSLLERKLKDL